MRLFNRKLIADFSGFVVCKIGPWLPAHRVGRNNLKAAFPEKSPEEIEQILAGTWDNLGRLAAEFVHLDKIQIGRPDEPGSGDVMYDRKDLLRLDQIRQNSTPAIFFVAHLANWEISAMLPPYFGFDSYVLYRPPSIPAINNAILKLRARCMGTLVPAGFDAPIRLAEALEKGALVGMLVDQHFNKDFRGGRGRGVDVSFFGRPCKANPLLAHLAQLSNCEIAESHHTFARPQHFLVGNDGRARCAAPRRRKDRYTGNNASHYIGDRRMDFRASRTMAVVSSQMAVRQTTCVDCSPFVDHAAVATDAICPGCSMSRSIVHVVMLDMDSGGGNRVEHYAAEDDFGLHRIACAVFCVREHCHDIGVADRAVASATNTISALRLPASYLRT